MLIFHEGLPGSGKSYEAVVKHIIPAIQKGRVVYARMDGFDDPQCITKIAEITGQNYHVVAALLVHVDESLVQKIPEIAQDNSLVVIDELQNH